MTGLQDMFEAESRHTTVTSDSELAAIADATIAGARRRHNGRLALQSTLGTVGALVIGAAVWTAVERNQTPVAEQPSIIQSPALDGDATFPQIPAITDVEWAKVDATWDMEWAADSVGDATNPASRVAVYLTPPGGERRLAIAETIAGIGDTKLAAWDPTTGKALVLDVQNGRLLTVDARTSAIDSAVPLLGAAAADGAVRQVTPLGQVKGDASYAFINSVAADGTAANYVVRWSPAEQLSPREVPIVEMSSASAGAAVGYTKDGLMVVTLGVDPAVTLVPNSKGCSFHAWEAPGTYVANCFTTDAGVAMLEWRAGTVEDPTSMTLLRADQQGTRGGDLGWAPYGPHLSAVDDEVSISDDDGDHLIGVLEPARELHGMTALDNGLWLVGTQTQDGPPVVVDVDAQKVRDLGNGFGAVPDTYAIVFGATP